MRLRLSGLVECRKRPQCGRCLGNLHISANELSALRYTPPNMRGQIQARGLHCQRTVRDSKYRALQLTTGCWTALPRTLQDREPSDSRGFPWVC